MLFRQGDVVKIKYLQWFEVTAQTVYCRFPMTQIEFTDL